MRRSTPVSFLLGVAVLASSGKPGGDASETCESRVESYEGYTEPISPSDACEATRFENGPSGYDWCLWDADPESGTAWVQDPSAELARATLASSAMQALLADDGRAISLGGYDELVLEADVPDGEPFEVWLGHGEGEDGYGCSYNAVGRGDATYRFPLADATWCIPSVCLGEPWASGVAVGNWQEETNLEITIESLAFETTSGGVGTVSAREGGIGPGGHCWFIAAWSDDDTSRWVEPPSCASVHAAATSEGEGSSLLSMQLADRPVDLTAYRFFEFDANLDAAPRIQVEFVNEDDGSLCGYAIWGEPRLTTYAVDLSDLSGCWGDSFDPSRVDRVDFITTGGGPSSVDLEIFDVRFVE